MKKFVFSLIFFLSSLPSSLLQGQLVTLFLLTYFNLFLTLDLAYYLIYNHNLELYMITVSKYPQMSPPNLEKRKVPF